MASISKRSWKLQEYVAHNANVNCLALGHKSGRVMVTGGDDKKVNLWAIGKESCFMSLSGHTTPIECVQFNHVEELVCAGSRAGALKVWDLEACKLVRTLTGHRDSVRCVDFHPYGNFLTSGGSDCLVRVWDSRKKGCITSFPGHSARINSVKFSPDGQWIASGGDDCRIKIWDLRIGRTLKEFGEHINAVTCVEFHPHEFLLASGSTDRAVNFFDVENFNLVSSEQDVGSVRCLCFNPDGECLFAGVRDYLKVIGWEPNRLYDTVPVNWGRICDISTTQNQLVGASFHLTNVMIHVIDLKKVQPFGGPSTETSPFAHNQSVRKSFSKVKSPMTLRPKASLDVKTIEESTSGTDPEEESSADITNLKDYNDIFQARQSLVRTPPPLEPAPFEKPKIMISVLRNPPRLEPAPFKKPENNLADPTEPQILRDSSIETLEALSLDNEVNYRPKTPASLNSSSYSRSKSNLDQVYSSNRLSSPKENNFLPNNKHNLQRMSSCTDDTGKKLLQTSKKHLKHSMSDATLTAKSARNSSVTVPNSFPKPLYNLSVLNNSSSIPTTATKLTLEKSASLNSTLLISQSEDKITVQSKTKLSPESPQLDYIPSPIDRPIGLDLDDFLPKNDRSYAFDKQVPDMSESEAMDVLIKGHDPIMAVTFARQRNLKMFLTQNKSKGIKAAIESTVALNDLALIVDLLRILNDKVSIWNLELCGLFLPKIEDLIDSKFELYVTVACNTLRLIVQHFGPVIRTNVQSSTGSFGVDITREERYLKSLKCYDHLNSIRTVLLGKLSISRPIGQTFKEILNLFQRHLD